MEFKLKFRSLLNYLKQTARWLWRGKYHILTILVVVVTILYLIGVINYYANIAATFLSVLGLLTILKLQILDAREYANYRPKTIPNWIKSFPTGKPIHLTSAHISITTTFGKPYITTDFPKDATIEDKVEFLLQQVKNIHGSVSNLYKQIDDTVSSQKSSNEKLESAIDKLAVSLNTTIAGHVVGAYDLNFLGIIMTICGILIQSFYS